MIYIKHVLRTLLGFYQRKYSSDWDKKLNELLVSHKGELSYNLLTDSFCTISLGDTDIWIENKDYAYYGHIDNKDGNRVPTEFQCRPAMRTMILLNERVKQLKHEWHEDKFKEDNEIPNP